MEQIRHLQLTILSIMKDIDALCNQYDIEYYLLGGSSIGAIRHHGFIPWDDDLDIVLSPENYEKFIKVCRAHLDTNKYYFQEGLVDWPLNFSKIRLKGTRLKEYEGYADNLDKMGIYLDVFKLENAPSNKIAQFVQYVLAKYLLCHQLATRTFNSADWKKKLMMFLSFPLKNKSIRNIVERSIEKYGSDTEYYGSFYFRTRFRTAFTKKIVFGKPCYVPFEDISLPVQADYHSYLTQMFGDYMTPPPKDSQVGLHLIDVDFGPY